jgi:phenylacetyl-CoA:acceptor oxidoreductase subunit 2
MQGIRVMQLLAPAKQKVWGKPTVIHLVMGGTAAGFYLLSCLLAIIGNGLSSLYKPLALQPLAPVLVCVGLLALVTEAGRPERALHIFRNICGSWMSVETLAATIFVFVTIVDWLVPHPISKCLAAGAALALMICQALIVHASKAITAWNVPIVPFLFVTSGFLKGSGLLLLISTVNPSLAGTPLKIALICILLDLVFWLLYLYFMLDLAFLEATKALRLSGNLFRTLGVGHGLPIILLLWFLWVGPDPRSTLAHLVIVLSGVAILVGGASKKSALIMTAGYSRGISWDG